MDITDIKHVHDTLAAERALLAAIVNGIPKGVAWKGRDGRFRGCNDQFAHAMGFERPADLVGLTVADIPFLAERSDVIERVDQQVMDNGVPVLRAKQRWKLPSGEERIVDVHEIPLRVDSQAVVGLLVMNADITDEERLAERVRESEDRWKKALEINDVGVWDLDVSTNEVTCSQRWLEHFHTDIASMVGTAFPASLVHPDDLPRFEIAWQALLQGTHETLETAIRMSAGGVYRYMKMRAGVVERDAAGNALRVVGTHVDIHEARQEQMQSANARKLEAIGQLAAGIAHEINTPTQFVGDNVRFLNDAFEAIRTCLERVEGLISKQDEVISAGALRDCLNDADMPYLKQEIPSAISQSLDGIQRIARIVGAMKEFSHPGQERLLADANRAIANTIVVATNEWKYVASIETELDATLPLIPLMPGEFNQVILNLLVNAAHAIAEAIALDSSYKGTIRVTTRHTAEYAEVSIADNGCGMPPEIQEKIFDPFFTTKPVGKGTGQGLAIAHNVIVTKHGGAISVKSEPGRGTTFTIRLPLTVHDATEEVA